MIPSSFEYFAPKTVSEAISLISKYKDEAKILAGGHSLIPMMKLRLAAPKYLIDLTRIPDLAYIREDKNGIAIGALTTHYMIESSEALKRKCPVLAEAAAQIGDVQVRNKGTIGGSLAHADPAADYPASILALDAEIKAQGSKGERTIKAQDFFVDMLTTALQPDEILTEIRIPALAARTGTAYVKLPQKASGFAIVGVAAVITLDEKRICQKAAIGVTGVASKPYRAKEAERALVGKALEAKVIEEAAGKAAAGIDPLEDIHASAEYRAAMASVYTKRAISRALERT